MNKTISISEVAIKQAGNALSFRKKIDLAKMLDALGVSVIECSPLANGRQDELLVKSLASAIGRSVLAVPVDAFDAESPGIVWAALQGAAKPRLQVELPVSTVRMEYLCHLKPAAVLAAIADCVGRCRALCPEVEFVADDFGRSDSDFLQEAVGAAAAAGATIVTVRDTAGTLLPDEFGASVAAVRAALPSAVRLGVWCSNEMYLADACAISAIAAGADEIKSSTYDSTTVSLKRFVQILKAKADVLKADCTVDSTAIQRTADQIKTLCENRRTNPFNDIEGLKDAAPEIQLTRADDQAAVARAVQKLGYDLGDDDSAKVYETFARLAAKGETVEAKELDAIVASVAFQVPPTYRLESYVINSGNVIAATCHLRLRKGENVLDSICAGDGPVDAAFQAIETVVDRSYELDDFQIRSVTEGREAMGEAVVRLRSAGKLYSGRGIGTDIIGSSIMAYLNAVNKIAYEEEQA